MITNQSKAICDAELGKPGNWYSCRKPATIEIESVSCVLHYCKRHAHFAHDQTGKHFRRAPFAEPREIPT